MSLTFQISSTLLNLPNQELLLSMAPREQTPCEWHGLSTPGSLLSPFPADLPKAVVIAHLLHVLVIFDRLCKLSASMRRIACPCSGTMPANSRPRIHLKTVRFAMPFGRVPRIVPRVTRFYHFPLDDPFPYHLCPCPCSY